mgnify:CR=1 FL=1
MAPEYIHSYSPMEQTRLMAQAEFLAPYHHPSMEFGAEDHVLEIGCGVGAQMNILLKTHGSRKITGIDFSPEQIAKARILLTENIAQGKAELIQGSGVCMPFADNSIDVVYIFWVLEHFYNPLAILKDALRVLKPGGKFYCTEVFNAGVYIDPPSTFLRKYWDQFNQLQSSIGGNPDIGIKLANYFLGAGYIVERFTPVPPMMDKRMTDPIERAYFLDMWEALYLSGYELLLEKGLVEPGDDQRLLEEYDKLRHNPDSIYKYSAYQVLARKPAAL